MIATMFILPAAIGAFLLVNLLCACVALGIGFVAGGWFFTAHVANRNANKLAQKTSPRQSEEDRRAADRAAMAASRVTDLAHALAIDVGDHAAKMKVISDELTGIDRSAGNSNAAASSAIDKILAANTDLQQRLQVAEMQLAVQAAEIKAHDSLARTDSLTSMSNRRAFDDELRRRLSEWQRKGTPCALVLLDIDFFKMLNDTYGHQAGDEVLRQVAKVLSAQSRGMDLPCRYGGEEFGVILPATDAASACKVAERIRAAIEQSTTVYDGKQLKITCSLGVSDFIADNDIARLIRRADEALYASKKAGRNCGYWNTGVNHVPINTLEESLSAPPAAETDYTDGAAAVADSATPSNALVAPTRATFLQLLNRRITDSRCFGVPISVMYVKIEEYKVMKAKYSSLVVREMVDAAARAFRKVLREMDVLTKLENGEFVILLPGSTQPEVMHVVKRMRAAAACCMLPMVDGQLQIHFQHGIAELNSIESAEELLARAGSHGCRNRATNESLTGVDGTPTICI